MQPSPFHQRRRTQAVTSEATGQGAPGDTAVTAPVTTPGDAPVTAAVATSEALVLREVAAVADMLREMLSTAGIFEDVEVHSTAGPQPEITSECRFAPEYNEEDIAEVIEWMWLNRVSFSFWQTSTVVVDDRHVDLQASTRTDDSSPVITVNLIARKVRIPTQRGPVD